MPRGLIVCLSLLLASCASGIATPARADSYHRADLGEPIVDFALRLERSDVQLRYEDGTRSESTVERMGIALTQALSAGLEGVLSAGYEDISQGDNPQLAGQAPTGYYGGIALRGNLLSGPHIDAAVSAHYSYHRLEATPAGQDIVLTWHQAWAEFVTGFRPTPGLRVFAGARYGVIDGEQRLSGTINNTIGFRQDTKTGYFGGLDVNVDRTGHVGFRINRGQFRGVEIFFARRFG